LNIIFRRNKPLKNELIDEFMALMVRAKMIISKLVIMTFQYPREK